MLAKLSQVVQTPEQYKWVTKLIGFDFQIFYKPGKENQVADALSRVEDANLLALSATSPTWSQELRNFYQSDSGQQLITNMLAANKEFQIRDHLLYKADKLFVPDIPTIRHQLLQEYHATPWGTFRSGYYNLSPSCHVPVAKIKRRSLPVHPTLQGLPRDKIPNPQTLWITPTDSGPTAGME